MSSSVFVFELVIVITIYIYIKIICFAQNHLGLNGAMVSALPVSSGRGSVGSYPTPRSVFEFINQFTIMKFQLLAVEYTGLQFTKGVFNPKPKAVR